MSTVRCIRHRRRSNYVVTTYHWRQKMLKRDQTSNWKQKLFSTEKHYCITVRLYSLLELLLTWSWAWSVKFIVSRSCFFRCRQLRSISHAFITSRLDYCNGLLAGAARVVTDVDVYQNVQNAAARLLTGHGRRQHGLQQIMRDELHWLRVIDRINYKFCLFVYKALHGFPPDYLSELSMYSRFQCQLPITSEIRTHRRDLIVLRVRLARRGQRTFAYTAPYIWNSLPTDLKDYNLSLAVFKRRLKSYC